MKLSGVRSDPLAGVRRRVALQRAAGGPAQAMRAPDSAAFLGLGEDDLTPAVQAALGQLFTEIDELRKEVARLRAHLAEAEDLADSDVLTPLLNRRAFVRELGRARTFAGRYGFPASLVYFDLDGFKALNDGHGHAAGDAALMAVAERLIANVRDSDIVGRMGGDEFAVVLVQTDRATAETKAAILADAIETAGPGLRVSYGVRELDPEVEPETLIADADAAMFAAKRVRKTG